jgi:integrase
LYAAGQCESNYSALLSFTVSRETKVYPTLPKSDIAKLLDAIDRTSISGKRSYAIMMLGTVLGLRACDVIALKLTDIDWPRGEIRIVQSKTSQPLVLPLTQDVGEALQDYILNARPKTKAKEVFLRFNAPHTALKSAVSIGEIYEDCCIAAGLPVSRRFHNLRRSLGTSMVANGVSVYDVAQVFGDGNVESVKPYIAADTEHLKMCALPFDGIAPVGGVV